MEKNTTYNETLFIVDIDGSLSYLFLSLSIFFTIGIVISSLAAAILSFRLRHSRFPGLAVFFFIRSLWGAFLAMFTFPLLIMFYWNNTWTIDAGKCKYFNQGKQMLLTVAAWSHIAVHLYKHQINIQNRRNNCALIQVFANTTMIGFVAAFFTLGTSVDETFSLTLASGETYCIPLIFVKGNIPTTYLFCSYLLPFCLFCLTLTCTRSQLTIQEGDGSEYVKQNTVDASSNQGEESHRNSAASIESSFNARISSISSMISITGEKTKDNTIQCSSGLIGQRKATVYDPQKGSSDDPQKGSSDDPQKGSSDLRSTSCPVSRVEHLNSCTTDSVANTLDVIPYNCRCDPQPANLRTCTDDIIVAESKPICLTSVTSDDGLQLRKSPSSMTNPSDHISLTPNHRSKPTMERMKSSRNDSVKSLSCHSVTPEKINKVKRAPVTNDYLEHFDIFDDDVMIFPCSPDDRAIHDTLVSDRSVVHLYIASVLWYFVTTLPETLLGILSRSDDAINLTIWSWTQIILSLGICFNPLFPVLILRYKMKKLEFIQSEEN